jgi:hypothetical protein
MQPTVDQHDSGTPKAELMRIRQRRELVRRLALAAAVPAVVAAIAGIPRPARAR